MYHPKRRKHTELRIKSEHGDFLSKLQSLASTSKGPEPPATTTSSSKHKLRFRKLKNTSQPDITSISSPITKLLKPAASTINLHLHLPSSTITHVRTILQSQHPDPHAPLKFNRSTSIPLFTHIPTTAIPEVHRILGTHVLSAPPFPIGTASPSLASKEKRPLDRRTLGDWALKVNPSPELVKFWNAMRTALQPFVPERDALGEMIRMFHAPDFELRLQIRMPACKSISEARFVATKIECAFPGGIDLGSAREVDGLLKCEKEGKMDMPFWNQWAFMEGRQVVDLGKAVRHQRGGFQTKDDYWATTQWRSTGLNSATNATLCKKKKGQSEAPLSGVKQRLVEQKKRGELQQWSTIEVASDEAEADDKLEKEAAKRDLDELRSKKLLTIWDLRKLELRREETKREKWENWRKRWKLRKLREGFQAKVLEMRPDMEDGEVWEGGDET